MRFLFFIFLIIFLSSAVIATGFSPNSLIFDLNQNEQQCQIVSLMNVTEEIEVINLWAENKDVEWKISNFNTDASAHGIEITYTVENTAPGEKKAEVCLSGTKTGEYRGVIIFRQAQQGNSVVQLAVWLKAIIKESASDFTNPNQNSVGGNANSNSEPNEETNKDSENNLNYEKLSAEAEQENNQNPSITGNTINKNTEKITFNWLYFVIPFVFIFTITIVVFYIKRREKRRMLGYI